MMVESEGSMKKSILNKVQSGALTPYQAYQKLYGIKIRRARFVKLRIDVLESPGVTNFLNALFLLPIPLIFGGIFIRRMNKYDNNLNISMRDIRKYAKGLRVIVESDEANVNIRVI